MNKIGKNKTKTIFGLFFNVSIFTLTIVLISFLSFSNYAIAMSSSTKQFAGKIQQTTTPPITCTSQYGVMYVQPKGGSKSPGPFIIESTSEDININGQILGRYERQTDMQTCYIQAGPYRIQVPVYKIKKLKTSKR